MLEEEGTKATDPIENAIESLPRELVAHLAALYRAPDVVIESSLRSLRPSFWLAVLTHEVIDVSEEALDAEDRRLSVTPRTRAFIGAAARSAQQLIMSGDERSVLDELLLDELGATRSVLGRDDGIELGERRRRRFSRNPVRDATKAGFRDARSNLPSLTSVAPWPTPAMLSRVSEGIRILESLKADHIRELESLRIRRHVAAMRLEKARTTYTQSDDLLPSVEQERAVAERLHAAAEMRLSAKEQIYWLRRNAIVAEVNAWLNAYWSANLSHRPMEDAILMADLQLPDWAPQEWREDS